MSRQLRAPYGSPKMPKDFPGARNNKAVGDLLAMVDVDVPDDVLSGWTDEQAFLAQHWAWKYYLRASDNIVKVPPRPDFLGPFEIRVQIVGPTIADVVRVSRSASRGSATQEGAT